MLAGQTKNLLQRPARPKPVNSVAKMKVVIILGHYNRIDSISGADRYISHHEDKNVLLDAPWTRVKREPCTTKEVG
jgi:hypothetical protein